VGGGTHARTRRRERRRRQLTACRGPRRPARSATAPSPWPASAHTACTCREKRGNERQREREREIGRHRQAVAARARNAMSHARQQPLLLAQLGRRHATACQAPHLRERAAAARARGEVRGGEAAGEEQARAGAGGGGGGRAPRAAGPSTAPTGAGTSSPPCLAQKEQGGAGDERGAWARARAPGCSCANAENPAQHPPPIAPSASLSSIVSSSE